MITKKIERRPRLLQSINQGYENLDLDTPISGEDWQKYTFSKQPRQNSDPLDDVLTVLKNEP